MLAAHTKVPNTHIREETEPRTAAPALLPPPGVCTNSNASERRRAHTKESNTHTHTYTNKESHALLPPGICVCVCVLAAHTKEPNTHTYTNKQSHAPLHPHSLHLQVCALTPTPARADVHPAATLLAAAAASDKHYQMSISEGSWMLCLPRSTPRPACGRSEALLLFKPTLSAHAHTNAHTQTAGHVGLARAVNTHK